MKIIYKYTLEKEEVQDLKLPRMSKILSVEEQFGEIVLYALVDIDEKINWTYQIFNLGTGEKAHIHEDEKFIGTVKLMNGDLMFHVFYREFPYQ